VSGDIYTRKMGEEYTTIFSQCISLNTELHKLVPLAKQMHLLSSNAVSSAARAGSEGDAFRVLTQDIQLLGDDVSNCIVDTQKAICDIVMLASLLTRLFDTYASFNGVISHVKDIKNTETSLSFFNSRQDTVIVEIIENNNKLSRALSSLSNILSPVSMLAKKGEYLAVCSAVEAASSGEHGVSFDAVSSMLRELVRQLGRQSARQTSLLRDLSEATEKQQINMRTLRYAR
jgi:methyl-accepting chemotaxis protein